ncbi:hypothetical protein T439DRAFT_295975 [Meredithblackwellia eburnea MCA 4105]
MSASQDDAGEGGDEEAAAHRPSPLSTHPDTFIRFKLSHIDVVTRTASQWSEFDSRVSPFSKDKLRAVPEIRIFGATDRGQRVVAHVHGAFPYVYVEYKGGKLDPDSVNSYIYRLGLALNHAMSLSLPSRKFDEDKSPQFVAFIVPCKGIPFYGFHVGYKPFLKIYCVDPRYKKRMATILRSGHLMKTKFEVFEDHVSFLLQFMLDANLYGCGWVDVGECLFRGPVPEHVEAPEDVYDPPSCSGPFTSRLYTDQTIPLSRIHSSSGPTKLSYCPLELDVNMESILNRHATVPRNIHHDFVEKLHPSSTKPEKLVHSVRELWEDERRRREARGETGPEDASDDPGPPREWDKREPDDPVWQGEAMLRAKFDLLSSDDTKAYRAQPGFAKRVPGFATFVREHQKSKGVQTGWLDMMRTTFEQVDAVFPGRMQEDQREEYVFSAWAVKGIGLKVARDAVAGQVFSRGGSEARASVAPERDFDADAWKVSNAARGKRRSTSLAEDGGDESFDEEDYEDQAPPTTQAEVREKERKRLEKEDKIAKETLEDGDLEEDDIPLLDDEELEMVSDGVVVVGERERPIGNGGDDKRWEEDDDREGDGDDEAPPPKRRKRAGSFSSIASDALDDIVSHPDTEISPPAKPIKAPQLPPPARHNPFSSPLKGPRVRFASSTDGSSPAAGSDALYGDWDGVESEEEDEPVVQQPEGALLPEPSPTTVPPTAKSSSYSNPDSLEHLPSDAFDDYFPTPTEADPGPSTLPAELRSDGAYTKDEERQRTQSETLSNPSATMTVLSNQTQDSTSFRGTPLQPQDSKDSITSSTSSAVPLFVPFTFLSGASDSSTSQPPKRTSNYPLSSTAYTWAAPPPSASDLLDTIEQHGAPRVPYPGPFYSKPEDVPARRFEFGGRTFQLLGDRIRHTPSFQPWGEGRVKETSKYPSTKFESTTFLKWQWCDLPPSWNDAQSWLASSKPAELQEKIYAAKAPQVEGPTQVSKGGPKLSAKMAAPTHEKQHMSILTMELQMNARKGFLPDPEKDAITALFYCFQTENEDIEPNGRTNQRIVGCIAIGDMDTTRRLGNVPFRVDVVDDERELISLFIDKVQTEWDPEIVAGYEVHRTSWGYLIDRARLHFDWDIVNDLGRMMSEGTGKVGTKDSDRWGYNQSSTLNFTGRHVFSIWRVLKADNQLLQNSFEHVAWSILKQRTPHFSYDTLSHWSASELPHQFARVFSYWINRVEMDIELLEEAETITQNSEMARVYGVDFKSVRLRGSQFRVEAVMFRIAKPESFLLLSSTREEVGRQNAAECQPLIMEPKSGFYKSPLLVLDFQSLYPSVMIAYNYCYSTCLGRIGTFKGVSKLGTTIYDPPPGLLTLLKDDVNISPNGFAFAKPHIRMSLLSKMLTELLDSRVMVKDGMKRVSADKALVRLLNGRQLALKLLANVTYGYTSATFSGRMPCVEIADAIVQTGRETLERAVETVRSTPAWGAEVVYGDTDSLFISLPGRSKADAFRIGQEIADKVTSQNPRPIKLKFEKVYLPSFLLAKKRYVGFSYETPKVAEPAFDAKGIETIRRDGFLAIQKMEENCLKILFRTADLSQVKEFCQRQWAKLLAGDVSPQDFTYAKAVKLGTYSENGVPPPGAAVATRLMAKDPRAEPSYGERVPYILIQAEKGTRQVDRAVTPAEFLSDSRVRLDTTHYITRGMIPALNRFFNLVGADVTGWFAEMPKVQRLVTVSNSTKVGKKALLDEHYASDRCLACDGPDGYGGVCAVCKKAPGEVNYSLMARARDAFVRESALHKICSSCEGSPAGEEVACYSLDCPTLYSRAKAVNESSRIRTLLEDVEHLML